MLTFFFQKRHWWVQSNEFIWCALSPENVFTFTRFSHYTLSCLLLLYMIGGICIDRMPTPNDRFENQFYFLSELLNNDYWEKVTEKKNVSKFIFVLNFFAKLPSNPTVTDVLENYQLLGAFNFVSFSFLKVLFFKLNFLHKAICKQRY